MSALQEAAAIATAKQRVDRELLDIRIKFAELQQSSLYLNSQFSCSLEKRTSKRKATTLLHMG